MDKYKIDVPVALIFFNRPDQLKRVFDMVKQSKPSKLFLIQDGARDSKQSDKKKMEECRKIVSDVNWKCDVYQNYSEENLGVGQRIYSGINWAFQHVDRLIILEDDCVPSESFFVFCKDLLEKYKHDQRINMISGMNHLGITDIKESYFYSKRGAIWGWATWKRVWDLVEYDMDFMEKSETISLLKRSYYPRNSLNFLLKIGMKRYEQFKKGEKMSAWSFQFRMVRHLYSQSVIVPSKNLVTNIGITEDSTHASDSLKKLPKGIRRVFFMDSYELEFPLVHPKYLIEDKNYDKKIKKILGESKMTGLYRKISGKLLRIVSK